MNNLLSERIAALRRERGLTQEQLGQLVGVSAQAVSKWENGGAPDVELLPAIADRLGVTIDGLFGRDDAPVKDFSQQMARWLENFPAKERMEQLLRVLASNILPLCALNGSAYSEPLRNLYSESCYSSDMISDSSGRPIWLRAGVYAEQGLLLGVFAKDFPLCLLLPEPAVGYEANFTTNEKYRLLFSALCQDGSLEILRYLYSQKENYYTAAAVAKRAGFSVETAAHSMEAMEKCHLLSSRTIETEDGSTVVYALHNNFAFAPFLYLARWLMEENDCWVLQWNERKRPLLCPSESEGEI